MIVRVRRGLESNRSHITPQLGEPIFTTDTRRLYVGDGVTPGGIMIQTDPAPPAPSTVLRRYVAPYDTPNGVRVLFTLPNSYAAGSLEITLNGLVERFISETSTNTFTFQDAPYSTDVILASYAVQ